MELKRTEQHEAFAVKITAEEEGKVLGWAYLYILGNDRHAEPWGFIENVYVEQEYRSQGIGKKLVAAIIEEAKQRDCYKLLGTSRHTKPEVHSFYEKFGFENWGIEFRMDLRDSNIKQRD